MDLITPTLSPVILVYAAFFSLAIAMVLRWRFKSAFGPIFMATSLFSLLVMGTTTYLAYQDFEQFIISRLGSGEANNPVILIEFIKYGLVNFVIILVINAIIAWLLQARTVTKLGN